MIDRNHQVIIEMIKTFVPLSCIHDQNIIYKVTQSLRLKVVYVLEGNQNLNKKGLQQAKKGN